MTESANLTIVTPSFITDAAGGLWSLVPSAKNGVQVFYNGAVQTATANVTSLMYANHTVYQNTGGKWLVYKNGSWVAATDPRESPDGATVTTAGPAIINSVGEAWTLVTSTSSGMQIACNGTVNPATANVVLLLYMNHLVYQQNSAGGWWSISKSTDQWVATTDPRTTTPTPPTLKESPDGTTVTTVGPAIINSVLESWTLVSSTSSGLQIACNGTVNPATANVVLLLYKNHLLYQQNSAGGWWSIGKSTDQWVATTDPRIVASISGVTLSSTSFTGGSPSGTVVGAIGVTMASGVFSGTVALSGTNASSFQIVGNNLVTNGVVAIGTYSVTITATQAGATGSPSSKTFSLSATSAPAPGTYVQVPLSIHLGTWLGDTSAGQPTTHYSKITSLMGREPTNVAAVGMNAAQFGGKPSDTGDAYNAFWNSVNTSVVSPLLAMTFNDGSSETAFANWANGSTATYAGQTYDYWLQNMLKAWGSRGFKRIYIRVNWEFNANFQGFGVQNAGNIPNWLNAWRHFANTAHTWGNANGIKVRVVWCSDSSYENALGSTFNQPVANFIPMPDANAVNGKYIDVVAPDLYAFGWGHNDATVTTTNNTFWYPTSVAKLAQACKCSFGISELGAWPYSGTALQTWVGQLSTWLNGLKTWDPPVPIEYLSLFDVNTAGVPQWSDGNHPDEVLQWKRILGTGAPNPIPITTIPVP